ncbi:MAG: hypothetical protein VB108_07210 [Anaerolineaceae bacterium]|nr:hypothetical protein [Anaerolineaceae bacterium]
MSPHYLLFIRTFQGQSEPILELARKAGAKGATVLHSRMKAGPLKHSFLGLDIANEEELLLIFADSATAQAVCRSLLNEEVAQAELGSRIYLMPVRVIHGFADGLFS